tara:strand:+ start:10396 stop:10767 length:372 start_codon:yes stop_codon:yes gene_type:complete
MAILYTRNTSGAIRRLRRKKPTKEYLIALAKHIKYLKKLGFNVDEKGRIKLDKKGRYAIETFVPETREELSVPLSNTIGNGGTKPDNSWKIEASKNFTIVPAYNKGPYMVVNKKDLKTAGRKV